MNNTNNATVDTADSKSVEVLEATILDLRGRLAAAEAKNAKPATEAKKRSMMARLAMASVGAGTVAVAAFVVFKVMTKTVEVVAETAA